MTAREILVTHALPYANGPLHIGHLLGYIQTDIWVRARRMAGDTVHFVAADDVHGTPIMLAAEKAGKTPEDFIAEIEIGHRRDFKDFGVDHDYYYTTHSPENKELAETHLSRAARREAQPHRHARRAAVLRSGQADVPAGSLHQRHVSQLRHTGSIRRQLRKLRRDVYADGSDRSEIRRLRRHAGTARFGTLLFQARRFHRISADVAFG